MIIKPPVKSRSQRRRRKKRKRRRRLSEEELQLLCSDRHLLLFTPPFSSSSSANYFPPELLPESLTSPVSRPPPCVSRSEESRDTCVCGPLPASHGAASASVLFSPIAAENVNSHSAISGEKRCPSSGGPRTHGQRLKR